jgi:hypothetical protein
VCKVRYYVRGRKETDVQERNPWLAKTTRGKHPGP